MNSLQFSIHIHSFDILGKHVLSEIDSAKERIVKLEILFENLCFSFGTSIHSSVNYYLAFEVKSMNKKQ